VITLLSNKKEIEFVTMPDYEVIAEKFDQALDSMEKLDSKSCPKIGLLALIVAASS
jgi:hypothetical protein